MFFVSSGEGMYVTKHDVREDQKLQAEMRRVNAEKPTTQPNTTGLDYSAIKTKFHFAWREFRYRYLGDPLRSMFTDEPESADEFDEIHDCEEIANSPIQECIDQLVSNLNPQTSDSELLASYTMLVDFAFQIADKIDRFVENIQGDPENKGYHSKFFHGLYDQLMDGAKLLRSRKIKVTRGVVYDLHHIGPGLFDIVDELRGKKQS